MNNNVDLAIIYLIILCLSYFMYLFDVICQLLLKYGLEIL